MGRVQFINPVFDRNLLRGWRQRLIVQTGSAQAQQPRLTLQAQLWLLSFHQGFAFSVAQA